jgi:hypothetical protein
MKAVHINSCQLFHMFVHLTKEILEGFGDCKLGGQIIRIAKYAHDLVLLAKEKTVLLGIIDKLNESGRYYGMKMNVEEKTKLMII